MYEFLANIFADTAAARESRRWHSTCSAPSAVVLAAALLAAPAAIAQRHLTDGDDKRVEIGDATSPATVRGPLRAVIERASPRSESRPGRASAAISSGSPRGLSTPFVRVDDAGRVHVSVRARAGTDAVAKAVRRLGGTLEVRSRTLGRVQAWLPLNAVAVLAQDPSVERIEAPSYAHRRIGPTRTQGDALLGTDALRRLGLGGRGVRIGIISDGYAGLGDAQAAGELPGNVRTFGSCMPEPADLPMCLPASDCAEGTAIAEIVHDVAPEAELAIVAIFGNSSVGFVEGARLLVDEFGADIVIDDLGFFGEPFFEDGELARGIARFTDRALFVSAAGNGADAHTEGQFLVAGAGTPVEHDFGRSAGQASDPLLPVRIPAGGYLLAILQWDDPFEDARNDYDLALWNAQGDALLCDPPNQGLCVSRENQGEIRGLAPLEALCFYNGSAVDRIGALNVERFSGSSRELELFTLGDGFITEYLKPDGSVFGHPALPDVIAVGAINAAEAEIGTLAPYSALGPSRITRPSREARAKPDVVSYDGVSVSGAGGFPQDFFGTSAAAPHVAAYAALLLESEPGLTPADLRDRLRTEATDLGPAGFDLFFGHGLAEALPTRRRLVVPRVAPIIFPLLDD